jgi:hypothetical protein
MKKLTDLWIAFDKTKALTTVKLNCQKNTKNLLSSWLAYPKFEEHHHRDGSEGRCTT